MSHEKRVTYVKALQAFVIASIQCIISDHLKISVDELEDNKRGNLHPNPAHEFHVRSPTRRDNVIDSIIEDSNWT
jgi:hypothetical protein